MGFVRIRSILPAVVTLLSATTPSAMAQTEPWVTFEDGLTGDACAVVNAENTQLVVIAATRQLSLVSGTDITLQDSFVDIDGFVVFEGNLVGSVTFAVDENGTNGLWWTSLTGEVVAIDGFTLDLTTSGMRPTDLTGASCDACLLWDDPTVCEASGGGDPVLTVNICGVETPITIGVGLISLSLMRLARNGRPRRGRRTGEPAPCGARTGLTGRTVGDQPAATASDSG